MRVGVVQFQSSDDPWANLLAVQSFVEEAVSQKCDLVCFPENIFFRGSKKNLTDEFVLRLTPESMAHSQTMGPQIIEPHSDFSFTLKSFAESWPIHVSLGSVLQKSADPHRPYNSHWAVLPEGAGVLSYHKIHLFEFEAGPISYKESDTISPGMHTATVDVRGWRFGLSICYDLRFPELYRALVLDKGAEALLMPAAFTRETGEVHWHALLKARAIENLSYVIAPAQWGGHCNDRGQQLFCYGEAVVYGPWGELICRAAGEGDGFLTVDLDKAYLQKRREQLPSLKNTFFRSKPAV